MNFLQSILQGAVITERSGSNEYLRWQRPAEGVLILEPLTNYQKNVVLSAGVHGNETAPIELLNDLISDLFAGKLRLMVRLMVILGNPEAIRQGIRYQAIDLNRLFNGKYQEYPVCAEVSRARELEQLICDFYAYSPECKRIHYDLHTAIKESNYQRFGLLPYLHSGYYDRNMLEWLQQSGLEALVVNHAPSGTFTYFTSKQCTAASCTLELGKARPFGENDLNQFALINHGLISLISGVNLLPPPAEPLKVYRVTQELKKISEAFRLCFPDSVKNFTSFSYGTVLAEDGDIRYRVHQPHEWVIFPNASVHPGLRAGLMLTETTFSSLFG